MNDKRARRMAEARDAIRRRRETERDRKEAPPVGQPARPAPQREPRRVYCPSCDTWKADTEMRDGVCYFCRRHPDRSLLERQRLSLGGEVL
jgi:hypothetical protein